MELPIDHFRLLGAGSTSDAQSVLHTLQLRIDRPPDQGFTSDTLQAREDLLRNSADLLSDSQRRLAYEADLTTLATSGDSVLPALEVPSSKEVGGLLLLLEAGQPLDCLDLAARALQPPQAPALGSGREADLALLAGLASLAGAAELRQQRRYEQAARVLRQGLQLLQRMGQLPAIRQQIADQLSGLRPYRVLDLLSRELASTAERAEGLALLQELVQERGGLEGSAGVGLPAADFQPFFQQIRSYLTVQEQVDLFSRWAEGSPAANLLAVFALTASGFVQRKPERIQEALERLEPGEEEATRPWRACLQLLLGEVPAALASFQAAADQPLRRRQEQPGDDPLARLCASCREWLSREVLPGYRDLEAEADLEAYFADRDVQDWVERHDGEGARAPSSDRSTPVGPAEADPFAAWFSSLADPAGSAAGLPPPASAPSAAGPAGAGPAPDPDGNPGAPWRERAGRAALACRSLLRLPARISRPWRAVGLGLGILLVVAVALRLTRPAPIALPVQPTAPPPPRPAPPPKVPPPRPAPALPLTVAAPSEAQLRTLLEAWLAAKAGVLAGGEPDPALASLATPIQRERLRLERSEDQAAGTTRKIVTTVESLSIEERDDRRIAAIAQLRYAEQRLDAAGRPRGEPVELQLSNRYVFARGADGIWRLASFRRA